MGWIGWTGELREDDPSASGAWCCMRRARRASPRRKVCDEAERGAAIADNRTVFATVGTTRFDGLVEALGTEAVQAALGARGFRKLVVQRGKSDASPAQRSEVAVECTTSSPRLRQTCKRLRSSFRTRALGASWSPSGWAS